MRIVNFILILIGCTAWLACSNQWREGDVAVDASMVIRNVTEALQFQQQTTGGGATRFQALYEKPNSRIYYSEAPSQVSDGSETANISIAGVAPVFNWSFMGTQFANLDPTNKSISRVRIFLVENESGGQSEYSLMIHLTTPTGQVVRTFDHTGVPQASDGALQLNLFSAQGGQLILLTNDVTGDGLLADVIQFSVFTGEQNDYVGKFSSLLLI